MPVGVYFSFEDATLDQYDEACRKLNNGQPMRALTDWTSGGILAHSVWTEGPGKLRVFDVWESPEAFQRFGEILGPILGELGIEGGPPHIIELHNFVGS